MEKDQKLHNIRHSLAHVLAAAVLEMFPKAQLGVGPVIENGFFYDFLLPRPLTPEDIKVLEKRMRTLVQSKLDFERIDQTTAEAKEFFTKSNQLFKVQLIQDIEKFGTTKADEILNSEKSTVAQALALPSSVDKVSLYKTGKFIDLCRGGHVENTSQIKSDAFKLDKVSGAYWRGDQANPQMQRVYGLAFETKEELEACLKFREEAEKRDHRKLGAQLDLYTISDQVGKGLPLFTPKGALLRELLNEYSQALRAKKGWQRVWSPHITKNDLYKTSGHWAKFGGELFLVKSQETSDELVMKPMNCPHHQQIYASRPHSYRELPIKYMETTTVYRDEKAGELLGLSRVRSITQDDSHTFCTPDQIEAVYQDLIEVTKTFYSKIGMKIRARLSFRDPAKPEQYLGEVDLWEKAQNIILKIAQKNKLDYFVAEGEAAFYGPKIDFMAMDALGREWQLATPQLDFVQPKRFGLIYTDHEGKEVTPVMIHFALMGSIERFLSVYIEHTAGAFPLWLAPVQIKILPISKKQNAYAKKVMKEFVVQALGLRIELDNRDESVGKKIREASMQKIPYQIILGEKEMESKKISIRTREGKDLGVMLLKKFVEKLQTEIEKKK